MRRAAHINPSGTALTARSVIKIAVQIGGS